MFDSYLASPSDLEVITDALKIVQSAKLSPVFKDRTKITSTAVVSYDSQFVYLWKINPVRLDQKIPHALSIPNQWQERWQATSLPESIKKYLPNEKTAIWGGLLTPFMALQKKRGIANNPYVTEASYHATIVHEFGHIYWNQFKLWWLSDKDNNLKLLKIAKEAYLGQKPIDPIDVNLPSLLVKGETFAFCTEYYASQLFWPQHQANIDKFAITQIAKMIKKEKVTDLDNEDSTLEPDKHPHLFAITTGKILLTQACGVWDIIDLAV